MLDVTLGSATLMCVICFLVRNIVSRRVFGAPSGMDAISEQMRCDKNIGWPSLPLCFGITASEKGLLSPVAMSDFRVSGDTPTTSIGSRMTPCGELRSISFKPFCNDENCPELHFLLMTQRISSSGCLARISSACAPTTTTTSGQPAVFKKFIC